MTEHLKTYHQQELTTEDSRLAVLSNANHYSQSNLNQT
jgi:hypothetical protein